MGIAHRRWQSYTDPDRLCVHPRTGVVDRDQDGCWFWGRPSFCGFWRDLGAASNEIRPDWDLGTPGLCEARDAGDRSQFHGWDRRKPHTARVEGLRPRTWRSRSALRDWNREIRWPEAQPHWNIMK